MRTIVHLSDLHFGTEAPAIAAAVLCDLARVQPHLVIVTGDLTQRARRRQFEAAQAFLAQIQTPKLIVPGNHDIPLYNLAARFLAPLAGFRRAISSDLTPTFTDGELAVAGVNTARSGLWKNGRMSLADIEGLRGFFCGQPASAFKILAAHHPFIPPENDPGAALVGRAKQALAMLAACGCHLILAGHLHVGYSGDVQTHHVEVRRSILVVQAGTAISHRRRDEPNAYNVLTVDGARLALETRSWDGAEFMRQRRTDYVLENERWVTRSSTGQG